MKKLRFKLGMTVVLLTVLLTPVTAQDAENQENNKSMFHLSFITPFGTNGLQSWNTINHFSINLFAGFSGGLDGLEMAGFANALRGDMDGIQLAGFCNNTFGQARGLEIAGFYNYNHGNVKGMQISGFANAAMNDVEGAQIAGFANASTGHVEGVQIAGFMNYAHKITGVQVAPFNVADTLDQGIAVGVWSWIRNGYQVVQVGANETLLSEISIKSGVKKFYNIVSVGSTIRNNSLTWGWGYGVGSMWELSKRFDVGLEAMSYHLNEDRWWSRHLNLLNRINLTASFNLTRTFSLYAGPSWNVWVSHSRSDVEHIEPISGDWYWYDRTTSRSRVAMYPGFNAGIRIGL